jgi:hypothetical protein
MEEFSTALREGDEGTVLRLVDADPTLLETVVGAWAKPLVIAARHGHLSLVMLLIERGADISGNYGSTPLHHASQEGHEEVVALLLKKGALANLRNDFGATPLMWACDNGHLGVVKMLYQHMGDHGLDDGDDDGWTALHFATSEGHEEVVRFLLVAGADPILTNNRGTTPRALAEETAYPESRRQGRAHCVIVFQVRPLTSCARVMNDLPCVGDSMNIPTFTKSRVHPSPSRANQHGRYLSLSACRCVWQWWQDELERRYVLYRATCLHKAYTTQRDQPTSQVPTYLEARVAAGHAVPVVEVVSPQSERRITRSMARKAEASGKRKAAGEGGEAQGAEAWEEEQRHAVLEYVVTGLNEALLTELLEGFH